MANEHSVFVYVAFLKLLFEAFVLRFQGLGMRGGFRWDTTLKQLSLNQGNQCLS